MKMQLSLGLVCLVSGLWAQEELLEQPQSATVDISKHSPPMVQSQSSGNTGDCTQDTLQAKNGACALEAPPNLATAPTSDSTTLSETLVPPQSEALSTPTQPNHGQVEIQASQVVKPPLEAKLEEATAKAPANPENLSHKKSAWEILSQEPIQTLSISAAFAATVAGIVWMGD
jgi:hypothetical protein